MGGDQPETGGDTTADACTGTMMPNGSACTCTYPAKSTQLDRDGVDGGVGTSAVPAFYYSVDVPSADDIITYVVGANCFSVLCAPLLCQKADGKKDYTQAGLGCIKRGASAGFPLF